MAQYTVKRGETLSGIARSLGLPNYRGLTGYRSGNPNLIYAGEVLNYGAPTPAPAAPAAPAGKSAQQLYEEGVASQNQILQNKLNTQKAEQEGLFGNYENIRKNQEALPALYNRLQTEAGIPELGQQAQTFKNEIYKTKGLLDRLQEDITTRTKGTLTNEAQVNRLNAYEGGNLRTQLGRLGTGLEPVADMLRSANESVGTQLTLNTQQQDRELEGVKLRINSISDRFAREISGYSMERESTLDGLLDKLQRERVLADRDWQLAQQLAAEERDFSRQKSLASQQLAGSGLGGGGSTTPVAPAKPSVDVSTYLNSGRSQSISGVSVARPTGISGVSVARPTGRLVVR